MGIFRLVHGSYVLRFNYLQDRLRRIGVVIIVKPRLDIIIKGAETSGSTEAHLVVNPLPLNLSTVSHPLAKGSGVRAGHLKNLGVLCRLGRVAADTPAAADGLVLVAEDVAVQELGALRVGRVLEDGARLGPGDELALDRVGDVQGRGGVEDARRGEAGGPLRVVLGEDCARCACSAHPAGVLGDKLVQPGAAVLLFTVVRGTVSICGHLGSGCDDRLFYLHQGKGEEDGVVVVGICQDELVLELWAEPVLPLDRGLDTRKLGRVPHTSPGNDEHAIVRGGIVGLELGLDLIEAERGVFQECILGCPAREVVQSLDDDAVDVDIVGGNLLVHTCVVVLGEVDGDVEGHAGETLLEVCLQRVLRIALITAVPECDHAALGESSLVDLVERAVLGLGCDVDKRLATQQSEGKQ